LIFRVAVGRRFSGGGCCDRARLVTGWPGAVDGVSWCRCAGRVVSAQAGNGIGICRSRWNALASAVAQGQCSARRTPPIAERVRASRPTVIGWRDRYAASGLAGLDDEPRSGRPRRVDHAAIVAATLTPPPPKYAVTHRSSRLLARHLRIGDATVAKASAGVPGGAVALGVVRFSTDPELVAKVTDVVGLYLAPPGHAVVLRVDKKSQIDPQQSQP